MHITARFQYCEKSKIWNKYTIKGYLLLMCPRSWVYVVGLRWHLHADNWAQPRLVILLPGRVSSDLERAHQDTV